MPEELSFGANYNLWYIYDAAGNKLAKVGTMAENNTRIHYSGIFYTLSLTLPQQAVAVPLQTERAEELSEQFSDTMFYPFEFRK